MTTEATIDYETLHQQALRGLVRSVLVEVAKSGLPGDHHFYISYDVRSPGVALSKRLREKYPTEMTIVLQHRFWDLLVSDERFEVKLTFDGIPERLVVPFSAIKVFIDPSAKFVLQFDDQAGNNDQDPADAESRTANRRRTGRPPKPRPERPSAPAALQVASSDQRPALPRPKPAPAASAADTASSAAADTEKPATTPTPVPAGGAQVVSLDAFRKK